MGTHGPSEVKQEMSTLRGQAALGRRETTGAAAEAPGPRAFQPDPNLLLHKDFLPSAPPQPDL